MKDAATCSWPVMRIGDIADHCLGKMLDKRKNKGTPRPYLRNLNVRWFDFDLSDLLEMKFEDHEFDRYTARKGDVLVCEGGYPGRAAIWDFDEPVFFQKAVHRVRFHEPDRNKWFLYYLLKCDLDGSLRDHFTGSGIQHFTGKALSNFTMPVPPLEEQRRIVATLDEAFYGLARARAHAEANLENSRKLFEAIKSTILAEAQSEGSPVTLDDVTTIASSLVDPREDAYAGLPHLGAGNMITGSDELIDVKTAREEKLISGKFLFGGGTVLYSKIRPYLRKAARPDFEGLCSADVYPLTPNQDRLDRDFLFHLLLADDFTQYAIQGSDRAGMPKVNRRHLFAYKFSLPPLDIQRHAAAKIDEAKRNCDLLVSTSARKLDNLEELRQSLLQKAFAGQLT